MTPEQTLAKYKRGFLTSDDLKGMASALSTSKAWWEIIPRAIQAIGVAMIYWMWKDQREVEMQLDKMEHEGQVSNNLQNGNEVKP